MQLFSSRMDLIRPSPASRLRRHVRELRDQGRDVIDLSSGDLDFPTPDHVIEAAAAAARRGETRYTNVDGTPELKDAIRLHLARQNGLAYSRAEVIVCNGSTQAIANAFIATLEPGDEVLVPSPCWAPYLDQVRLVGGKPVMLACEQNHGFKLRAEELAASITPRTRWLVLNNPVNPTGAVYSASDLAAVGRVLADHPQVWLLSDNLYENIVFDGVVAKCLLEVEPRLRDRTLVVSGVAKTYAMMGWRIGYAAGPVALVAEIAKIQSVTTSCASSIGQAGAVAALLGSQDFLVDRLADLAARRNALVSAINACEGLVCSASPGTFYVLASCADLLGRCQPGGAPLRTDEAVAEYLLKDAGIAVLPGSACGLAPYLRMNFALSQEILDAAASRIRVACASLVRPPGIDGVT